MESISERQCSKCGIEYPETAAFFDKQKGCRGGLRSDCKSCRKQAKKDQPSTIARRKHAYDVPLPPETKVCPDCIKVHPLISEIWGNYKVRTYCLPCRRKRFSGYRSANPEAYRMRDRARVYTEAEKERRRLYTKDWRACNPERSKQADREKRAKNPMKYRLYGNARKARAKNAPGRFVDRDVQRLLHHQRGCCFWCKKPLSGQYQADHVIPLNRGGSNWPGNIVLACQPCNGSRQDKLPVEWSGRPRML